MFLIAHHVFIRSRSQSHHAVALADRVPGALLAASLPQSGLIEPCRVYIGVNRLPAPLLFSRFAVGVIRRHVKVSGALPSVRIGLLELHRGQSLLQLHVLPTLPLVCCSRDDGRG